MGIYLDYNASAPIDTRVLDEMIEVYKTRPGNADSRTHDYGDHARMVVENARKHVARLLDINTDEVFFTSGATESNNIAIQGLKAYANSANKKHIITSSIEHKAVIETVKAMEKEGFDVDIVDPEKNGRISVEKVLNLVREDTLLVSIMHVNNETGIIQPVAEIGEALDQSETLFHVDATQSFGKLVPELKELKYNMLSMSAHKVGGPQGIGALVLRRKNYKLPSIKSVYHGGQQEHGIRPGTVPVALVAGLGKACEIAGNEYTANMEKCRMIKKAILESLNESGLHYSINGAPEYCVDNTINICLHGVNSEALMLASKTYCGISNGSACNSNSYNPSYVLTAMGVASEDIDNSIRISWGAGIELSEVKSEFDKLLSVAKDLVW